MKKGIVLKLLPIVSSIFLSSCFSGINFSSNTYGDIIKKDVYAKNKASYDLMNMNLSQVEISRCYAQIGDAVVFDVPLRQKFGTYTGDISVTVTFEDLSICFQNDMYVPWVWNNHQIVTFSRFVREKRTLMDRETFEKIKNLYEGDENDFSILSRTYVETND